MSIVLGLPGMADRHAPGELTHSLLVVAVVLEILSSGCGTPDRVMEIEKTRIQ